jgi:hypothetical protein
MIGHGTSCCCGWNRELPDMKGKGKGKGKDIAMLALQES